MSKCITARHIHAAHAEAWQAQYRTGYIAWDELNASQMAVYQRMASLLNKHIAFAIHRCVLPIFEEEANDIPPGYGIEHSHDGGFYPYEIDISDPSRIGRLKDSNGLDMRCSDRDEAIAVLMLEVLA